jgi:hypothetical protein
MTMVLLYALTKGFLSFTLLMYAFQTNRYRLNSIHFGRIPGSRRSMPESLDVFNDAEYVLDG